MCELLDDLCTSMRRFSVAFDASTLTGVEADVVVAIAGGAAPPRTAARAGGGAR
jgi:hypothetical protein